MEREEVMEREGGGKLWRQRDIERETKRKRRIEKEIDTQRKRYNREIDGQKYRERQLKRERYKLSDREKE